MNFFKLLLGSCLGTIAGILLLGIISFTILAGLASVSSNQSHKPLDKASFLEIRSDHVYPDKTDNVEKFNFSLTQKKEIGLTDLLLCIKKASSDSKIKGILFRSTYSNLGAASAQALHNALLDFKKSGKPIYAYADVYTEGAYYLASTADKVMLNPNGTIDFRGYGAMIPFFKDLLDKVGIKFDIYYAGQFKSATEPFRLDKMSDQNRKQTREYLEDLYQIHLADIASSRNIPIDQIRKIASEYLIQSPQDAVTYKLADTLGYVDDLYKLLQEGPKGSDADKPSIVTINRYFETPGVKPVVTGATDRIAVVYAEGEIVDGEGKYGQTGSAKYTRILRKIREDDKVKAVVLRINSPGGSSMASDNILHEVDLIKSTGKPIVVSMGDYAASGGYYIACHADSIFAQANTITGSIGVFFMVPNASELLNEKLGVNIDTVKTAKYATAFSPLLPWSSEEGVFAQKQTDMVYEKFLTVVSKGRHQSKDDIHAIAQGRVWSGARAKSNGLVDQIGDLNDAMNCAARLAKLEKYKISEYPLVKDSWTKLIEEISNEDSNTEDILLKKYFKSWYPAVTYFKQLDQDYFKPKMLMPFQLLLK